ncbi:hypothetical protein J6590_056682 [Homalodisca vitripennis]|nr:hypothetical protein J6590_056682 [Homalodisca vitripennis]
MPARCAVLRTACSFRKKLTRACKSRIPDHVMPLILNPPSVVRQNFYDSDRGLSPMSHREYFQDAAHNATRPSLTLIITHSRPRAPVKSLNCTTVMNMLICVTSR